MWLRTFPLAILEPSKRALISPDRFGKWTMCTGIWNLCIYKSSGLCKYAAKSKIKNEITLNRYEKKSQKPHVGQKDHQLK